MSVPDNLRIMYSEKTFSATRAPHTVKCITFNLSVSGLPRREAVCSCAQAERERGPRALLAGSPLWHCWLSHQHISGSERRASTCGKAGGRNGRLRHLQDLRRPVLIGRKAEQYGAWWGFRARTSARSAQIRRTRKPRASIAAENKLNEIYGTKSIAIISTIRSWPNTAFCFPRPITMTSFSGRSFPSFTSGQRVWPNQDEI